MREGRTGGYWPEVVAVRTELSQVRTKTTEGQSSSVRLELARLVSSLLYHGPRLFWIFRHSKTKNTQLMTIATETVRMGKSRPRKNQLERSDLPFHLINWFILQASERAGILNPQCFHGNYALRVCLLIIFISSVVFCLDTSCSRLIAKNSIVTMHFH